MNKRELIEQICKDTGLTKSVATSALNATLKSIKAALQKGDRVGLVGFGSLDVVYRKARKGVNPSSQKVINIADKVYVKFRAGKELSTSVDNKTLKNKLKKKQKK